MIVKTKRTEVIEETANNQLKSTGTRLAGGEGGGLSCPF